MGEFDLEDFIEEGQTVTVRYEALTKAMYEDGDIGDWSIVAVNGVEQFPIEQAELYQQMDEDDFERIYEMIYQDFARSH